MDGSKCRSLRPPTVAQALLRETRRELALFASDMMGAQSHVGQLGGKTWRLRSDRKLVRRLIETTDVPSLVIDPRPGLRIVDCNQAYATITMTNGRKIVSEKVFDVFPDNPELEDADGIFKVYESLKTAARTGRPHVIALQRYDIRGPDGCFVKRFWQPTNTPIFDGDGRLIFLLHNIVEVGPDGRGLD